MQDVILLVIALVIIILGVRLAMKFREMAGWKDDDVVVEGKGSSALPSELRELKIEDPADNDINSIDATEDKRPPGSGPSMQKQ
jgi:hypothetical protein